MFSWSRAERRPEAAARRALSCCRLTRCSHVAAEEAAEFKGKIHKLSLVFRLKH